MATFIQSEIFQNIILPFVLIFTLVFALLEKSKLLGENKKQINAIIGFVVAAILVTFSTQVDWIRKFSVFLAVGLVLLFVLMLIWSFAWGTTDGDPFKNAEGMKKGIGWVAIVAVVIGALVMTGYWDRVYSYVINPDSGSNLIFLVLIIIAIVWVMSSGKSDKKEEKKKEE
jgi:Ca2+/Na+ antiporter